MMLCTLSFNDHLLLMHVNMCAYLSEVTSMYMFIGMLNKLLLFHKIIFNIIFTKTNINKCNIFVSSY